MSAPSRLKRESFARRAKGSPISAPSLLKRESFARSAKKAE